MFSERLGSPEDAREDPRPNAGRTYTRHARGSSPDAISLVNRGRWAAEGLDGGTPSTGEASSKISQA